MTKQLVTYTPEQLDHDYTAILEKSVKFADQIASGVKMADLGSAQEELIAVSQEIASATKTEDKGFFGKLFETAKEKAEKEVMKRQSVQEVTDRMFQTLSKRQEKLIKAVKVLEKVEESLKEEAVDLMQLEQGSNLLLTDETLKGSQQMVCTSVATQCGVSIMKNQKNQQTVDVVMKTAMELSTQVAQQLPKLRQALNSELTMAQTLNELREFKEAFDATTDAIDAISDSNNDQMFEMMNAVLDVQARDQKEVERIDRQSALNKQRTEILREKVRAGRQHKIDLHEKVTEMRKQNHFALLGDAE